MLPVSFRAPPASFAPGTGQLEFPIICHVLNYPRVLLQLFYYFCSQSFLLSLPHLPSATCLPFVTCL